MGYLLKAICSCGYESKEIMQGIGFDYARKGIYYEPAWCDNCGIVEARDGREEHPECKTCHAVMHFYQEEDEAPVTYDILGLRETDYDKRKWHCPRCQQQELSFVKIGLWD